MKQALERRVKLKTNLTDLYHFNKEILGYSSMEAKPHKEMCDFVEYGGNRQLLLYPRGHFKSSCITVGYALYRLLKNPNIRILIVNLTLQNAKSFLREIKGHLENNDKLIDIVGKQRNKDDKWTETEITIRDRSVNVKESSITVAGSGVALVSQHYDIIIADDIENQDTVSTKEQLEKTRNWFKLLYSLLDPGGKMIVIGTRYHYEDIYSQLIKQPDYEKLIKSCYDDKGKPIFPKRFTKKILASLKASQGSYIFGCQYLNSPVDSENAKFKKSDIKYYTNDDLRGKTLFTVMCIDRAYSLNKSSDFTGLVVASLDQDNNLYVRFSKRLKCLENEIINWIFLYRETFDVNLVGIEQKAYEFTLKPTLDSEMRARNNFFSVSELKAKQSKIMRIERLVPRFEVGSIFIRQEMVDLEDELLRFPMAEHDDLADALAYTLDLLQSPINDEDRELLDQRDQIMESEIIFRKAGWWNVYLTENAS